MLNILQRKSESVHQFDQPASIFKLLAHPARLAILETLRQGDECVCHMEAALGYRQAYLSQQLAVLREAGIIQDRRDGWNIFYRVINLDIYPVLDAVYRAQGEQVPALDGHSNTPGCPCPKCNTNTSAAVIK
jgi:ArsR family transcriptional regulator